MLVFLLICANFIVANCEYVVQTTDGQLHFLLEPRLSFNLQLPSSSGQNLFTGKEKKPSLAIRNQSDGTKLAPLNQHSYSKLASVPDEPRLTCQLGRLNEITINNDGYLDVEGNVIPLTKIYRQPFFENGIMAVADTVYNPRIMNNTLCLTSLIEIKIYDLYSKKQRNISFGYLVFLREYEYPHQIDGTVLHIDDKEYHFDSKIVSVFRTQGTGAYKWLERLVNPKPRGCRSSTKQELRTIQDGEIGDFAFLKWPGEEPPIPRQVEAPYKSNSFYKPTISGILAFVLFVNIILSVNRRNLRRGALVSNGIYKGQFVKKPCLIYEVNAKTLEKCKRGPSGPASIEIYMMGRAYYTFSLGRRIVVTEPSSRYSLDSADNNLFKKSRDISRAMLPLATELRQLHDEGKAHGRLCPANIRLTASGKVKAQLIFQNNGWESKRQILNRMNKKYVATRDDDVFSFGCIIHFLLYSSHPFDSLQEFCLSEQACEGTVDENEAEDISILEKRNKCILEHTVNAGNKEAMADDFIYCCLNKQNVKLDAHPFFWDWQRKGEFICLVSDYIESHPLVKYRIEALKEDVFTGQWNCMIDRQLFLDVGNKRLYDSKRLTHLIRITRNYHRHLNDLINFEFFQNHEGGVIGYFLGKFPKLLIILYRAKCIRSEPLFKSYF